MHQSGVFQSGMWLHHGATEDNRSMRSGHRKCWLANAAAQSNIRSGFGKYSIGRDAFNLTPPPTPPSRPRMVRACVIYCCAALHLQSGCEAATSALSASRLRQPTAATAQGRNLCRTPASGAVNRQPACVLSGSAQPLRPGNPAVLLTPLTLLHAQARRLLRL